MYNIDLLIPVRISVTLLAFKHIYTNSKTLFCTLHCNLCFLGASIIKHVSTANISISFFENLFFFYSVNSSCRPPTLRHLSYSERIFSIPCVCVPCLHFQSSFQTVSQLFPLSKNVILSMEIFCLTDGNRL